MPPMLYIPDQRVLGGAPTAGATARFYLNTRQTAERRGLQRTFDFSCAFAFRPVHTQEAEISKTWKQAQTCNKTSPCANQRNAASNSTTLFSSPQSARHVEARQTTGGGPSACWRRAGVRARGGGGGERLVFPLNLLLHIFVCALA